MRFVLASHNKGKLAEMQAILGELGVEVVMPSDVGVDVDVEETGTTFAENAALKANAIMAASGLPAIADDSGLCVDWLQGAPGVYSARYGGLDSDPERCRLLLSNMRGATNRAAHFHTAIVCAFPNGDTLTAEGDCAGTIAFAPMGDGGFGYDPVFFVPSLRKTFAQLTAEEKNAISHRGSALRAFAAELKRIWRSNDMELTSKQRAQLRSLATNLDTIVHVGKDGIGDNLIKQVNDALEARELIKGRVLENSLLTAREAAEELAVAARCEVVQVIGSKFVLYRMQHDKSKRKIELVKAKRSV